MPAGLKRARDSLLKISISIAPEAEDAFVELLDRVFAQPASVYSDLEKHTTSISIFVPAISHEERALLSEGLAAIEHSGLKIGPRRISVRRIPRENWAESWKRHFKPIEIGPELLVLPSWSKRRPKHGQAVVILDPGLSFGTGHHPTTAFCLQQIAALRTAGVKQSLLDVGCGSGILSIAAAKLGYAPVIAIDFDPDAVRVAKENAAVNRVLISLSRRDLTKMPMRARQRFDVVCANLIYDLLIQEREKILGRLSENGTLVLAGILNTQFAKVRRAYEAAGLKLAASRTAGEWRSGAFTMRR